MIYENDEDIVRDYCNDKSERAATAFVRKYQSFVFGTALRYLQSYDDAEDVSQEVFIRALDNLKKFRGDSSLKTWLYCITVNMSTNEIRKKKIVSFFKRSDNFEEDYEDVPDSNPAPDVEFDNKEFEKSFKNILNKLPLKQRETFALRYFEDLSYDEISNMIGTTVGGIKANYFQAVHKIAKYLKKNIISESN